MAKLELVAFGFEEGKDNDSVLTLAIKVKGSADALMILASLNGNELPSGAGETVRAKPRTAIAAAAAGPAPTQAYQVQTEIGAVTITPQSGGAMTATFNGKSVTGATEDEALGLIIEAQAQAKKPVERTTTPARGAARQPAKPAAAAPEPEAAPAEDDDFGPPADETPVPTGLANAQSFRQVMDWMLANGLKTKDKILGACNQYKGSVPAIGRLSGDLGERIDRALVALQNTAN